MRCRPAALGGPGSVAPLLLTLDPATSAIPVIVCSADHHEFEEQAAHLRAVGAVPLRKPFQMPALLAALGEVLGSDRPPNG